MNSGTEIQSPRMPSRGGLLLRLGGSLAAAAVLVVAFVLPAEYHVDPTGLGQVTGLMALSAPAPLETPASLALGAGTEPGAPARSYEVPFRSDEVAIPLRVDEQLEYKVKMQPGGTLIYSWDVDEGDVFYDFHGESAEDPTTAHSYSADVSSQSSGSLIAPFAGIHGWFLQNLEDSPVIVRLKMSGFYELRDVAAK